MSLHRTTFDFSCLVLKSPTPTLLGMPPEVREIILGYAIADIMGSPPLHRRHRRTMSVSEQADHRKHVFRTGQRTFFALLITCRTIRDDMPRVVNEQLKASFNGWRDVRSRRSLLDPDKDFSGMDERWSFLLRALMKMEGIEGKKKEEASRRTRGGWARSGAEVVPRWLGERDVGVCTEDVHSPAALST